MSDLKISHSYDYDYNKSNDRNEIDEFASSFLEQFANKEDLSIDIETLLSKEGDKKSIDLDRFLGFLQTILGSGSMKVVIGENNSSKEMLKIASLLSSSLLLKEAKEGETNTKKVPLANVILQNDLSLEKEKTETTQIKDGSLKDGTIKDLSLKDSLLKEAILNGKEINIFSNLDKTTNIDKNQSLIDRPTLKNQVESMLKFDSTGLNKVTIKDGLVVLHSLNGSLSMDNLNVVGAKGDLSFLDNSREFANQSGYKENTQSDHKGNDDEDDNTDERDQIFFSGD